jgi:threonine dehydrogenase-like Zn-dependent dehydrogenase
MQRVLVHGPNDVRLDEGPEPTAGPRDAVLRLSNCGICGSDLSYIRSGGLPGLTMPLPLGHELSGVVEWVGPEVRGLTVGTRAVLNPNLEAEGNGGPEGGFRPRLLVRGADRPGRLVPIPAGISDEQAALVEPLGVGMHAVDRAHPLPTEKIVVFGVGPIGLAALATLRDRGIRDVVAIDLSPRRLQIAKQFGARACLNPADGDPFAALRELHGNFQELGSPVIGTDVFIEASGAPSVIPDLVRHAKRRARISVVALHFEETVLRFLDVMMKELDLLGAMEYPDDFGAMLGLLGRWDLSAMITHRFPLAHFHDALAAARDARNAGKVMIHFG